MFTRLIITICILFFCTTSIADVVEYRDEADWFAASGGAANITTIGFTEFPNNTTLTDQYSNLGVTFEGLNFVSGPFPVNYQDSWGLRIFSGNDLIFSEPINSFATTFLGIILMDVYLGDTFLFTTSAFGINFDDRFGGFVSDEPFDRIFIYDPSDPLTVLDDLFFGPMIAVPAPGALAALLGGLCILRKRRR